MNNSTANDQSFPTTSLPNPLNLSCSQFRCLGGTLGFFLDSTGEKKSTKKKKAKQKQNDDSSEVIDNENIPKFWINHPVARSFFFSTSHQPGAFN
jgi:hypothetical protein